jgi:hypothetical protein
LAQAVMAVPRDGSVVPFSATSGRIFKSLFPLRIRTCGGLADTAAAPGTPADHARNSKIDKREEPHREHEISMMVGERVGQMLNQASGASGSVSNEWLAKETSVACIYPR